jgi:hypothetical protein
MVSAATVTSQKSIDGPGDRQHRSQDSGISERDAPPQNIGWNISRAI